MNKLEFLKVETDTTKIYNPHEKFTFKLVFNNQNLINDDLEFEVFYFGDAYSENHDQKICHNVIGPLEAGKLSFELETNPIDLTKIPIKTLFGLTTILIVGKFHGEQFIRIGYVLDVKHHGIDSEKLIEVDEQPIEEEDDEGEDESVEESSEEGEDDSIEIDDGEECSDEECENEECCDEECENGECCEEESEVNGCNVSGCCGGECEEDEECDAEELGLENAIADALLPKRAPIPLETPIVAGQDEFEYKGMKLYQSKIEMTLLDKPIIQVYEIDWNMGEKNDNEDIVESSENETNHESCDKKECEPSMKKQKVE